MASNAENFGETSGGNSSPEKEAREPSAKKRRPSRKFHERAKYQTAKEAESAVEQSGIWSKKGPYKALNGDRVYYQCKQANKKVAECPAALYLLYHKDSNCVTLFEADDEHANHVECPSPKKSRRLTFEERLFVRRLLDDGIIEPNDILRVFRDNGMIEPDRSELINVLETMEPGKNIPQRDQPLDLSKGK